ncbi:putative peroxisomal-coenzyme A synthetase [Cercospora beticola]|uniref:Putative peroxisomal-coenzyme A synthetase n=1 Tax=Cercospora beticola TaxID=122368 RepID=A0A2G5HG10_CERBT|nr:putative peroxisomal-coenzyme A synthetase [Cercospora beticola]PIA91484.1 putative peroxisomal-coenzyme A synthetase [Cercospora beticola]WPB05708.1 hypothetical protein RHO25_010362 [Cercospora beticola]CAK1365557.1 unnamed protein product [Cercospora beticola]
MSDTEERLKSLWAEVLGRGTTDLNSESNWFEVGGDSVLAIRLVNSAGQNGIHLSNQAVFDAPTLSGMAKAATQKSVGSDGGEPDKSQALGAAGLMQQWDIIKTCLEQTGIENHELEDIAPCAGFQEELMRATNDTGIFMIQVIFNAGNEKSISRAKTVIDRIVQSNSIFRTRVVQHEQDFYQVVVKKPIEWTEFDGTLEAYKVQDEARRIHYGDPLIRLAVVRDPHGLYIVWTKSHAAYDRWSRYELMNDLEAGFLNPAAFLENSKRPDFRSFVDGTLAGNAEESMQFWQNRLKGVEKFDLLFPESKQRDYMSSKTDRLRTRIVACPKPKGRVGLDAINTVGSALLLANESGLDDVFFMQVRSCRQLPIDGIDSIIGPLWTPCPIRRKLKADTTLQSLLEEVSEEANQAIPHEAFGSIATLQHFGHRRFYQFVTMMQPPKTANFDADLKTRDEDGENLSLKVCETTQTRNFFGFYLMQNPIKDDKLEMWVRYDDTFLSPERVEELMDKYCKVLETFNNNDWNEITVADICPHIRTSSSRQAPELDSTDAPSTLAGIFHQPSKSPALIIPGEESLTSSHEDLQRVVEDMQKELANFGVARAIAAPLNPAYKQDEFEFYIDDLGSAVAVIPRGSYEEDGPAVHAARKYKAAIAEVYWDAASNKIVFDVKEKGKLESDDSEEREVLTAQEDDVALVLHTSGTTDRPKAVPLTHSNLLASIRNICRTYALRPDDRTMLIMPLFHVHGLLASFLSPLYSGGSAVVPQRLTPEFWKYFEEHGATWYTATPSMHRVILSFPKPVKSVVQKIRFIRSCSSQLSESWFKSMSERFEGVPIVESYAMTEASHLMTSNPLTLGEQMPGSVGQAAEGVEVKILGQDDDNEVKQGEVGEVCIQGENVTKGYLNNPDANKSSFTESGFFRTGDQGKLDENGFLFLTGRLKELINKGGENISPVELDNVINKHEDIVEAVSFAIDDEAYDQDVGCAVKAAEGKDLKEDDLKKWIAERVAAFKVPKKIWLTDEIPKTATGKVQRKLVAEKMVNG